MNNKIETGMFILLLLAMFVTGFFIRELQGNYVADRTLTKKIQDSQDQYKIQYQELAVCKWERNIEQSVVLDTTITREMLS